MKKNKWFVITAVVLFLSLLIWVPLGVLHMEDEEENYYVSVIINNSSGNRWTALREGMEQAAGDCGVRLNFVSTGEFVSVEEELEMIRREQESGADGIVVQMYSSSVDMYAELSDLLSRDATVLIETDVEPEGYYQTVGPDNYEIGAALAEAIREDLGEDLAGCSVGILCGNMDQLALQQRLRGFQDQLSETGADYAWILQEPTDEGMERLNALWREQEADIVVALENDELERTVDFFQERPGETILYGVGSSEKVVYYLDKGVIRSLVAPNEFNMGYQGIEELALKLGNHLTDRVSILTGYLVVDRENLYDAENQKILFPIVQ